jgi:maltokinase
MSQHLDGDTGDIGPAARAAALTDPLTGWLPEQRWYAGRGRPLAAVVPLSATNLVGPVDRAAGDDAEPGSWLDQVVVEARYRDGGPPERYQLFLGYLPGAALPDRLAHVHIGQSGGEDGLAAFEGLWDRRLANAVLELIATDTTLPPGIRFRSEAGATIPTDLPSRVVDAQQSNTSVVYDETAIMKVFRRVVPGRNPDLELNRALRRAGSQHVPELLGEVTGETDGGEPVAYAMLSGYAANSAEGWAMATASVRDLFAEADLRADEVGGDFASEAERLGEAIAAVHADLAAMLGSEELDGPGYAELSAGMLGRLAAAVEIVPELAPHAEALRAEFAEVARLDMPFPVQRIHGDLHLGQVLREPAGWLVIDFEGEPIKPLPDRLRPDSPLRDVAGMLRSFDYAAAHLLVTADSGNDLSGGHQLEFRAQEWADRNRKAFCAGYGSAAPVDPMVHATLLRAYELDKAVYEAVYETRHRPTWREIPLRSIARMLDPE